jgi:hypothetical protein
VGQSSEDGSTSENPNGCHDSEKEVAEAAKVQAADDDSEYGQQPTYDSAEESASEGHSVSQSGSDGQPSQSPAPAVAEETQPGGDYESAAADSRYGEAVSPSVAEENNADSESSINPRYEGEPGETSGDSSAQPYDADPDQNYGRHATEPSSPDSGAMDESGNSTGDSQASREETTSRGLPLPVVDTVAKAAARTLSDFGTAVWSLSCQIAATDWQSSF